MFQSFIANIVFSKMRFKEESYLFNLRNPAGNKVSLFFWIISNVVKFIQSIRTPNVFIIKGTKRQQPPVVLFQFLSMIPHIQTEWFELLRYRVCLIPIIKSMRNKAVPLELPYYGVVPNAQDIENGRNDVRVLDDPIEYAFDLDTSRIFDDQGNSDEGIVKTPLVRH